MLNALATGAAGLVGPLLSQLGSMGSKAIIGYAGRRLGQLSGDSEVPQTLSNVTQKTVDTLGNNLDLQRRLLKVQKSVRQIQRSISPVRRRIVIPQPAPTTTTTNMMEPENENELGFY